MAVVIDYLQPGPLARVDTAQEWMLQDLPVDPIELCAVAQALILRPVDALTLGLPAHRIDEQNIRSVRELIAVLAQLYPERLHRPRPPAMRAAGTSRHVAVLASALLRARGFPARVRAGFVTRDGRVTGEGLWTTEYWSTREQRWIRAGTEVHSYETAGTNSAFGGFLTGGEARQQYRGGLLPQSEDDQGWGPVEISCTTVRALAALCQVEMLPDDAWGRMAQVYEGRMPAAYDNLIDVTAAVCAGEKTADLARLFSMADLAVPRHMLS